MFYGTLEKATTPLILEDGPTATTRMIRYNYNQGIIGEYRFLVVNKPEDKAVYRYYPMSTIHPITKFIYEAYPYDQPGYIVIQTEEEGTVAVPLWWWNLYRNVYVEQISTG